MEARKWFITPRLCFWVPSEKGTTSDHTAQNADMPPKQAKRPQEGSTSNKRPERERVHTKNPQEKRGHGNSGQGPQGQGQHSEHTSQGVGRHLQPHMSEIWHGPILCKNSLSSGANIARVEDRRPLEQATAMACVRFVLRSPNAGDGRRTGNAGQQVFPRIGLARSH